MSYENQTPDQAQGLLSDSDEWTYLDVRTTEEFEAGHVPGAYNIPVVFRDPSIGMAPNPDFVAQVQKHFGSDSKLVVGCAAGGRSARACEMLAASGYGALVNMHGGFSGAYGPAGNCMQKGWAESGLPVETETPAGRGFADLQ